MRLFGRRKATSTPEEPTGRPATGPDDPRLAEVREYAADAVHAGFSTLDEITERALHRNGTTSARIAVDVSDWRRPLPVE